MNTVYIAYTRPPLMKVLCYSALNAVKTCKIMFDFYPGLPHIDQSKLAIMGQQVYSDAQAWRENCVNIRRYCKTIEEVCGTRCSKNDARALSPVGIRSIKMAIRKTSIYEKCIYFQTPLFMPSLKLLLSIDTMPQAPPPPNLQYIFVVVAVLNTQGHN